MFKGLSQIANIGSMLRQAQQLGSKMQDLNEQLKQKRAIGNAGGGMIEVEVNGLGEVIACRIEPELFAQGDREMIEDLLPAAFNQAHARSRQLHADAMRSLTEGMDMPGLDEALAKMTDGEGPAAP